MKNTYALLTIFLILTLTAISYAGWSEPVFVDSLSYSQPPWNAIEARNDSIYLIYDFFNFIRSIDGGLTWQDPFFIDGRGYMDSDFKLQGDTLVIFFIGSGGERQFYFSSDFGESWQGPRTLEWGPGIPISANHNHNVVSYCLIDIEATHIFLKTSTDFGITWAEAESIWTFEGAVFSHILYYFYDRPYILSTGYGGEALWTIKLLFSPDNGESWIAYDSLSEIGWNWEQWMDASDGGQMAFVYHHYTSRPGEESKVLVCLSPDSGLTWTAPIDVSLYDINYFPSISVSGDTVVVAWDGRADTSDSYGAVLVRRTFDFGESWEAAEIVTEREENGRFPEITIDGQTIHLIYKTPDGLYYRRWEPETGVDEEIEKPEVVSILKNYPNPFNASTKLTYALSEFAGITISIYNIVGQRVATIFEGTQEAGEHSVTWYADDFPSGVYFARVQTGDRSESIKMVLLK
jgi:hypothetical protein